MVDKIQYGNYHEKLSSYLGCKVLLPLSDCQQVVKAYGRRKNHSTVKTDGKICVREDIDAFIRMLNLINLQIMQSMN